MRPLPLPDQDTAFFWEGTAQRKLLILRCEACGSYVHYPKPACPLCGAASLTPTEVSGRGHVHTFTVTHRAVPGFEQPFVVAMIELDEQPGLRLISNVIGVEPDAVSIGMRVEVTFQPAADDVWLPVFRPEAGR
ncbi:MAG TPA: Zn-ribbon domain-containing OB-fold protein [Actinomycetota bacterium]|jgi:hypothetical protein